MSNEDVLGYDISLQSKSGRCPPKIMTEREPQQTSEDPYTIEDRLRFLREGLIPLRKERGLDIANLLEEVKELNAAAILVGMEKSLTDFYREKAEQNWRKHRGDETPFWERFPFRE